MKFSASFFLLSAVLLLHGGTAFLPGIAPIEYTKDSVVPVKVINIDSSHTQMPFKYYSLPFCTPEHIKDIGGENLGEILMGYVIENSPYNLRFLNDEDCTFLCSQEVSQDQIAMFHDRISEEYRAYWILDNLPAATRQQKQDSDAYFYEDGFAIGEVSEDDQSTYLNNHLNLKIFYHNSEAYQGSRIVAFEVLPQSVKYESTDRDSVQKTCRERGEDSKHEPISGSSPRKIAYTYSVTWELNSEVRWASRWDVYMLMTDDQIHWLSIINSLMIVLFLTGMVAMIMLRTIHADFVRYQQMETSEEAQEDTGWKLVHGDVFRAPSHPMLLSVLVGTGVQTFLMAGITLFFSVAGFLSPAHRGLLLTVVVFLFAFMGAFAGYTSAQIYKMFKGQHWKKCMFLTSFLVPGFVFGIFFILDICLAYAGSSGAVGTYMLALIALWFCVSVPLVFLGSYFGFKQPVIENPVRTNQIPRQIPEQVWYMKPLPAILIGGVIPFGAVFIELFFIMSSVWLHKFYYIFGFLSAVFIILVITCGEITIVMCYFQLCSEDYHWWWRSFLTSGASAAYFFLYSTFYFFTSSQLHIDKALSALLFYGYTLIFTTFFFCLTGALGFYSCFFFVRRIYSQIKVD